MDLKNVYNKDKARAYEKNTLISLPTYDLLFEMIRAFFRAQLEDKKATILIAGVGGGKELSEWGPLNANWSFIGFDPSEDMLQIARGKSEELGLTDRVELIHGTIDDLDSRNPLSDAASCILVLHFIADVSEKLHFLKNIHGQLKQGSPFVLVSAYGDRESSELQERIKVWQSFFLDMGYTKEKVAEMAKVIMNISFVAEEKIIELLEQAGFTRISRFYATGLFAGWTCYA